MKNNLLNITNKNPYYQITAKNILKYLPNDVKQIASNIPQLPIIATDNYFIHYSIYPILAGSNEDDVLQKVLDIYKEYSKTKEYQQTKILTTLDHDLSMIHSISLTRIILEKIKKEVERQIEQMQSSKQGSQQSASYTLNQLQRQAVQGNQKAQQLLRQLTSTAVKKIIDRLHKQLQQMKRRGQRGLPKELKEMFEQARKTTERAKDLKDLMQSGKRAGKTGTSFEKLLDLTNKLISVEKIDEILSLSKKITDHMPKFYHIRKVRDRHGTELYGYRLTKNIEHALARELALPDELFYYKLANQGLLAKEKIRVVEGAYYVIIDKSGSMKGAKTIWARSVALALFRLAKKKNRKYFLRFFDTKVYPKDKPIKEPEEIVEHIVRISSVGGTSIDTALLVAIKDIKERKLSKYTNTIILITDGEDEVNTKPELLKENNITLVAVMIRGHNETLKKLAEESGGQYLKAELNERGALKIVKIAGGEESE